MDHSAKRKFAGQDRWLRDLGDIQRVSTHPRVGRDTRIDGAPVRFDHKMLTDLLRRREAGTENDSLRSRRYDGGGGAGNSNDTQTEAAALRGLSEATEDAELAGREAKGDDWRDHGQPDPVGALIEEALAEFDTMARAARKFEVKLMRILNAGGSHKERRPSVGHCQACGRDVPGVDADGIPLTVDTDRLRSGYCDRARVVGWSGCYREWLDQGRPDRVAFESWVREQVSGGIDVPQLYSATRRTGYAVDEIDTLQASGILPQGSAA